jgi:hypothetical protein
MKLVCAVKNVDWAVLVRRILRDTKCSNKELGEATGIHPNHISKVKNDYQYLLATPDQTMALLMAYMANTSRTIPVRGDFFKDEPIDQ